jgi:hypothetical protein
MRMVCATTCTIRESPLLFSSRRKQQQVQSQLVKLLNNHCNDVQNLTPGPRCEDRVNLTIPVLIAPWQHKRPSVELAFSATTRELSSSGLSVVVPEPVTCENVVIGWCFEQAMRFAQGKFRHQDPIGAGFWNAGLELIEMLSLDDYPELRELSI